MEKKTLLKIRQLILVVRAAAETDEEKKEFQKDIAEARESLNAVNALIKEIEQLRLKLNRIINNLCNRIL